MQLKLHAPTNYLDELLQAILKSHYRTLRLNFMVSNNTTEPIDEYFYRLYVIYEKINQQLREQGLQDMAW